MDDIFVFIEHVHELAFETNQITLNKPMNPCTSSVKCHHERMLNYQMTEQNVWLNQPTDTYMYILYIYIIYILYILEWFLATWKKIKLIFFMMAPFYFVPLGVKTICVKLF